MFDRRPQLIAAILLYTDCFVCLFIASCTCKARLHARSAGVHLSSCCVFHDLSRPLECKSRDLHESAIASQIVRYTTTLHHGALGMSHKVTHVVVSLPTSGVPTRHSRVTA